MKKMKRNINGFVLSLFEMAVGILLLINPRGFTTAIITVAGVVLAAVGIFNGIKYFRFDAEEAVAGQYLTKGLIAVLVGVFCILKSESFAFEFSSFTVIYGIVILFAGLGKVQLTVDMIRRDSKKWFLAVISSLISIIWGIVILNDPFTFVTDLWLLTGIVLIAEAVIDFVTLMLSQRQEKEKGAESANSAD